MSGTTSDMSSTLSSIMQQSQAMEEQNLQEQFEMSKLSNSQSLANNFEQTMASNAKQAFSKD
ncbi:hypothetical protein J4P41_12720 [Gluconobacter sp. NFX36]|uniref:Uncharacterized protein n=1 Tax=Gluconobacter japonicus TaxID=376620 RepID=A0A9Q2FND3_GLUJA|nr:MULTISPECIES: hypothetical protein [Acetobacteraceae]GAP24834.1 hypothetical protein GLF_1716 [Gluconobacter frateurii NBRC 101659]KXV28877.1 hypothetical protein AD937_01685 [Gluconobacter japonicus]KXV29063.1 hypothetical protein AD938_03075 [Gluconobacter japonicus]KXV41759.1 hypothetical protein AD942_01385 [Gluconobacter japonicus]MBF0872078.1 hypothetical protein [Gluconobacter japonicus]